MSGHGETTSGGGPAMTRPRPVLPATTHPSPAEAVQTPGRSRLSRFRSGRLPRWWEELLFIVASYALYSVVRNYVPSHRALAFANARHILHVERLAHLDAETPLNHLLARSHVAAFAASYWYAIMHFIVTIAVLVWLYARRPLHYRAIRTSLYVTNVVALAGFWLFPLAPPRMMSGFVDTVDRFPTLWLRWDSASVASISNQFAAMPSLHIGWSLWCGLAVWRLARHRWVKFAGLAYPCVTLVVVLGTANHYLLDVVGGVLALALGSAFARALFGRPLTCATDVDESDDNAALDAAAA